MTWTWGKRLVLAGVAIFAISALAGWWCARFDQHTGSQLPTTQVSDDPLAGVPESLRPLTIPGLAAREYDSRLEIGDVLESGSNYTAYRAWYNSDGYQVYGLLVIPDSEPPEHGWPVVILMHGYLNPATYQTNGKSYRGWWQQLAREGEFAIFKPDLRGHGESEGHAGGAYFAADYVADALNARAALQADERFDPLAIGFWGHSMSGNTLLRAYASHPDIPIVALWAGAVYSYQDFIDYGITDPSYVPDPRPTPSPRDDRPESTENGRLFTRGGGIDLAEPFWAALAPTNFLDSLSGDSGLVALFHAANDAVVSVNYSRDLAKRLEMTAIPHEYHEYVTGGHNLEGATFSQAYADMLPLLREQLIERPARLRANRLEISDF